MTDSMITLQGYVGTEPTLRDAAGTRVANFRLASTPRRLIRSTGEWVDGETQWYTVSAWRHLADNVAQSVHRGDPVFVHGRLTCRTWVNRDGVESTNLEIEAMTVGHDLNRVSTGTVRMRPVEPIRAAADPERRATDPGRPPADWMAGPGDGVEAPSTDPWADELAAKAAQAAQAAPDEQTSAA